MHVFTDIFQYFVADNFTILTSMGEREKNMETRQIYARYVQYNRLTHLQIIPVTLAQHT